MTTSLRSQSRKAKSPIREKYLQYLELKGIEETRIV